MKQEIDLLLKYYPNIKWQPNNDGGWVLIPNYQLPQGVWDKDQADLCFEVKNGYPGVAPYSFYVRDGIKLKNGSDPQSYTYPSEETIFDGVWGKFSWAHAESWRPTGDLVSGSNLLNFVTSFADRLREAS